MAGTRNLYLALRLMAISSEPLEICVWNFVCRWIVNTVRDSARIILYINDYKHHNFTVFFSEILLRKLKGVGIYTGESYT